MDLPDRADLFAVGRRSIRNTPNKRINPSVVDTAGSDANLILGAESIIGEEIVARFAKCARGLFVETARDDQLDRVAFDRYGLTRFPATPSLVTVSLTRPTAAGGAGTYPAGSRIQTATGVQFATDVDAVFGASTLSVTVNATALVAGPESNVPASAIVQFSDSPFDSTLTVTNAQGAAGGREAESDLEFRARIRQFFPTVRRGVLGAIEFGALQVPQVAVARAIEIVNPFSGFPAAAVQLIVADRDGASNAAMTTAVKDKLLEFRAAGIFVLVTGGTLAPPTFVTWDIDFDTGVDTVSVSSQVRAVTSAAAQFLAPGETLFRSALIAAARTVPGAIVRDTSLVVPVGDVVPTSNELIIRILPQNVTFV